MKNFYNLSPGDAIQYYINHDQSIITAEKSKLPGVSIVLPTSRTAPDYKKDAVNLKNMIQEAEKILVKQLDKREYPCIIENLKKAHDLIDYSRNMDTLVVYANDCYSAVVTLPIESKPELTIGRLFDIRPLYKAKQQSRRYYILAISKKKIRLFEAMDNHLVQEIENDDFPFDNDDYFTTDPEKLAQDSFTSNLIKEFFNVSDKQFKKYQNQNQLPFILAGDVKMMSYYAEMMDDSRLLIGCLHGNYVNLPVHEIIAHAYPVVKEYNRQKEEKYLSMIEEAQSAGKLVTDYDEINRTIITGNAQTLYMGENFSLRGRMEGNYLIVDKPEQYNPQSHELTLHLINHLQKNGGTFVFLDDDLLDAYQGMVLVKRI